MISHRRHEWYHILRLSLTDCNKGGVFSESTLRVSGSVDGHASYGIIGVCVRGKGHADSAGVLILCVDWLVCAEGTTFHLIPGRDTTR